LEGLPDGVGVTGRDFDAGDDGLDAADDAGRYRRGRDAEIRRDGRNSKRGVAAI
jgi:hypothetical protein